MRKGHASNSPMRGAMSELMAEVIEDHVRKHLVEVVRHLDAVNPEAADALVCVVRAHV
jgi:FrmR/RcnR family transcriptional regulator, repressor of frmRAB operon